MKLLMILTLLMSSLPFASASFNDDKVLVEFEETSKSHFLRIEVLAKRDKDGVMNSHFRYYRNSETPAKEGTLNSIQLADIQDLIKAQKNIERKRIRKTKACLAEFNLTSEIYKMKHTGCVNPDQDSINSFSFKLRRVLLGTDKNSYPAL